MGNKIKLSMNHPFDISRGKILHFKHPRVSTVKSIATRTFRDKNRQQMILTGLPIFPGRGGCTLRPSGLSLTITWHSISPR